MFGDVATVQLFRVDLQCLFRFISIYCCVVYGALSALCINNTPTATLMCVLTRCRTPVYEVINLCKLLEQLN